MDLIWFIKFVFLKPLIFNYRITKINDRNKAIEKKMIMIGCTKRTIVQEQSKNKMEFHIIISKHILNQPINLKEIIDIIF
jgi:hypothetical protein